MPFKSNIQSTSGQRVAVDIGEGYYAPATIQSIKNEYSSNIGGKAEHIYMVCFEDGKLKSCKADEIVGLNFKTIKDISLQPYQKVYTTYKGSEASGYVLASDAEKVKIQLPGFNEKEVIEKRIDEISLYTNQLNRKTSEEPTMTELIAAMVLSKLSCSPVFHNQPASSNLGTSPQSLSSSGAEFEHMSPTRNPTSTTAANVSGVSEQQLRLTPSDDPSDDDVNMILINCRTPTPKSTTNREEVQEEPQDLRIPRLSVQKPPKDTHQPMEEQQPSTSQPTSDVTAPVPFPVMLSRYHPYIFPHSVVRHPLATSLPPDFQFHLSPLQTPVMISNPRQTDISSSSLGHTSDGKISYRMHHHRPSPYHKVSDESVTSSTSTSSPNTNKPAAFYPFPTSPVPIANLSFSPTDHSKRSRTSLAVSPTRPSTTIQSAPLAIPPPVSRAAYLYEQRRGPVVGSAPIGVTGTKSFSWQNEPASSFSPKPSIVHQRQQIHQLASPKMGFSMASKPLPIGRKVRGDGKKCRKVYGMERRDLWCTACRWKKACQRFPD